MVNVLTSEIDYIDKLFSIPGLFTKTIEYLNSPDFGTSFPCFRILGVISGSTTSHTQMLIDYNLLPVIQSGMYSNHAEIRKESFFVLSNIAAGVPSQVKSIFDQEGLIKDALKGLTDCNLQIKKEAWHVLSNISEMRNKDLTLRLLDFAVAVEIPKSLAFETDPSILKLGLRFCSNLLIAGQIEYENTVSQIFYASGCFEVISKKRDFKEPGIRKQAEEIIDNFYLFE